MEADDDGPSAQGTVALLGALSGLTNLEHLSLGLDRLDTEQNRRLFASLTASSKLTSLELDTSPYQPLPERAASSMFSRPLPQLQRLCISKSADDPEFDDADGDGYCISKLDLCCIVRNCLALQQLDLRCTVTPGKDVSALQELQACSVLIAGGRGFADQQAEVIGQLTWLTELQWHNSPTLTDVGLEQLTTLINLGRLWAHSCYGLSEQVFWTDKFEILSRHDKGPVWQQLDKMLDDSPKVTATRLRRLRDRERQLARVARRLKRFGGDDLVQKVMLESSTDEGSGSDGGSADAADCCSEETGSGSGTPSDGSGSGTDEDS